jgi:hypothetical protein
MVNHSECINKLVEIGQALGFHATARSHGKMYHLGNPDCVWYYKGPGHKELSKIARGDKYKYLPFIAFEVPYSEKEKALRGSLVTLQLTNASASIIVLIGESLRFKSYVRKLVGRYSFVRYRIWLEKDVEELHHKVMKQHQTTN